MTAQQSLRVIGIDPGPVPGIVELRYAARETGLELYSANVFQCTADVAPWLVQRLLGELGGEHWRTIVAIERFVVGKRSSRSSTAAAGATTRDLVGQLLQVHPAAVLRSAAEVKPWATDERLKAARLAAPGNGSNVLDLTSAVGRHSRDAARHALFAASKDGGVRDPLSRSAVQS